MTRYSSKIMQIIFYLLIVVVLAFVISISRNCTRIQSSPIQGYSEGDTIDVALLYGPSSVYMYPDTLSGINFEIAAFFDQEDSRPMKLWAVTNAEEAMKQVEKGAFDILASLPLDNELKSRFPTSESIFLDRLVLVQLKNNSQPISSSLDLSGKSIHIASGSPAKQRLENLSKEIGGEINIIEEPDLSDELITLKIADGSLPYAVVNEKVAKNVAEKYPELSYDTPVSFTQFQVWIFNPEDSVLQNDFNRWFEVFKETEDYQDLINNF